MSRSTLPGGAEDGPASATGCIGERRGARGWRRPCGLLGGKVSAANVFSRRRGRAVSGLSKPSTAPDCSRGAVSWDGVRSVVSVRGRERNKRFTLNMEMYPMDSAGLHSPV